MESVSVPSVSVSIPISSVASFVLSVNCKSVMIPVPVVVNISVVVRPVIGSENRKMTVS